MRKLLLCVIVVAVIFYIGNDDLKSRMLTLLTDAEPEESVLGDDTLMAQATNIIDTAISEVIGNTPSLENYDDVEEFTSLKGETSDSSQSTRLELYNISVLDGDTIKGTVNLSDLSEHLSKSELAQFDIVGDKAYVTVRYLLTDTPESVDPDIPEPQPYALSAKDRNAALVGGGTVMLEFSEGEKLDKYSRLLAYVFLMDNLMVQETLIREGYARVAYVNQNTKYLSRLNDAQSEAKNYNRGIWSIEGYVTDRGFNP
ncbi:endonuclease [Butyricicoccus sp. 1XD8-22]|nr:endonuclease [Butyricicoccus sp. 1XD8-22]